jgi:ornithine carbamoyltransferase
MLRRPPSSPSLAPLRATLSERLLSAAELDEDDGRQLLASARRLRRATRGGDPLCLLKGRHIAIEGEMGPNHREDLFEIAATRLGARVSWIVSNLLLDDTPQAAAAATRMLPRLYDALECNSVSAERALELHRQAGVPVYLDLGGARHPIRALLCAIASDPEASPDRSPDADLTLLMQAVLVETLT